MIKTIIFDIGNVLMRFEYKQYVKELLKDDHVIEKVNEAMWGTGFWNDLDLGKDQKEVFSMMYKAGADYEKEIRLTLKHLDRCIHKTDYAIPWIRGLKYRGYQVLYLSNYSEFIMDCKREVLDFLPLMDGGIFSCYVGLVKPDPAIFRRLCDKYDLKPEECVFIDDNKENIEAAGEFGFNTIRFEAYEQAKERLEEMLLDE